MEKECSNCKYNVNGYCPIIVWDNSEQMEMGYVAPEDYCGMWEEKK